MRPVNPAASAAQSIQDVNKMLQVTSEKAMDAAVKQVKVAVANKLGGQVGPEGVDAYA
jgi:hypothetical protein